MQSRPSCGPGGCVSVPYRPVFPPGSIKLNVINNVEDVAFVNIGTNGVMMHNISVDRQQRSESFEGWDTNALYTGEQGSVPLYDFGPGSHTFTAYGFDRHTGKALGVAKLRVEASPSGTYRYLGHDHGFEYDGVPSVNQGSITWVIEKLDRAVSLEEASR